MKLSRRNFLHSAGVANPVAFATPTGDLAAQSESKSLPAAIARLKPRKSEASPITVEERQQRIDKARRLMAENKIDAVMITGGTSLVYFSNIHWWMSERLFAMVLPVKGSPFYVCPAFEEDRAREQIATGPGGTNAEVRLWQEGGNPSHRISEGFRNRGISSVRTFLATTVRPCFFNRPPTHP